MSSNNLREDMCMLCRDIGKDLCKFNVNVIAVENIINNGFTHFRIEDAQSNGSNPVISAPERGILNEKWCKNKSNNKCNDNSNNTKKYCFIHSCHLKEVGIGILNDIIGNFININDNLIQYFEKIFIVNIGEKIDLSDLHLQSDKIEIINYSDNIQLFEIPTINLIRVFCEYNENCEILYLHTKGVSYNNHIYIKHWRDMMLYFLLEKCLDCFELLKKYDTIGCNYMETELLTKHYSGNFWWANSNYIKKLDMLSDSSERHAAEIWILSDLTVNSFEIYNSRLNHYHYEYPREAYIPQ